MTNHTRGIEGGNIAADFLHSKGWHMIQSRKPSIVKAPVF